MPMKNAFLRVLLATQLVAPAIGCADDFRSSDDKRWWQGEWKAEFRDGPCLVKQDVKHDEFKEEVKCERLRR